MIFLSNRNRPAKPHCVTPNEYHSRKHDFFKDEKFATFRVCSQWLGFRFRSRAT